MAEKEFVPTGMEISASVSDSDYVSMQDSGQISDLPTRDREEPLLSHRESQPAVGTGAPLAARRSASIFRTMDQPLGSQETPRNPTTTQETRIPISQRETQRDYKVDDRMAHAPWPPREMQSYEQPRTSEAPKGPRIPDDHMGGADSAFQRYAHRKMEARSEEMTPLAEHQRRISDMAQFAEHRAREYRQQGWCQMVASQAVPDNHSQRGMEPRDGSQGGRCDQGQSRPDMEEEPRTSVYGLGVAGTQTLRQVRHQPLPETVARGSPTGVVAPATNEHSTQGPYMVDLPMNARQMELPEPPAPRRELRYGVEAIMGRRLLGCVAPPGETGPEPYGGLAEGRRGWNASTPDPLEEPSRLDAMGARRHFVPVRRDAAGPGRRESIAPARRRSTVFMKPKPFEGRTPWEDYQKYFERLADVNEWGVEDMRRFLLISLSDMAQQYVDDLADAEMLSYGELCEALAHRFGATRDASLHRATLRARVRKREEDLYTLGQEVRRLVRLAYPGGGPASAVIEVESFVNAIPSRKLKEAIYASNPRTIDAAVQVGVRMEAFFKMEQGGRGHDSSLRQLFEVEGEEGMLFAIRQGEGTAKRICWGCWEEGHFRRDCPTHPYGTDAKERPEGLKKSQLPYGRFTTIPQGSNPTYPVQGTTGSLATHRGDGCRTIERPVIYPQRRMDGAELLLTGNGQGVQNPPLYPNQEGDQFARNQHLQAYSMDPSDWRLMM